MLICAYTSMYFMFCFFVFSGLDRCGKSCRFRWLNYLRPDVKRGRFTRDEEKLIITLHAALGNRLITN